VVKVLSRLVVDTMSLLRPMRFALALFVVSVLAVTTATALTFPTLTGRVVDDANILDAATRAALTEKLATLETKTTDQLVVVTLKSLQGTSIEDFGYQLGRAWGIGQKGKNNGALLIVAPNERKVRIEVGYGLEGTLTDALTKVIIESAIIPRFRANDFPGGITRGTDSIIQVLSGDAELFKQQTAVKQAPGKPPLTDFFGLLFVLVWLGLAAFIIFTIVRSHRQGRGGSTWFVPVSGRSDSWSSGSSGGFDSGGGFSGGGGDFGGGGSSGSW
jgi:uncharacterized protein